MKNEGIVVGILGTVIFHLVAAIIFMSFKLYSLEKTPLDGFAVEFVQYEEKGPEKKLIELPVSGIEKIVYDDQELLNLARNLANKPEEQVDPSEYIDMVKEELIRDGKLGPENFIDDQKRADDLGGDEKMAYENDENKEAAEDQQRGSRDLEADYQGPTRIYYNLEGRNHTYLPIPIYKCQGSGIIVLSIEVNRKGTVEEASVIDEKSTASDPCLIETAVTTALVSRFTPGIHFPPVQKGTLTYQFVAQ
jgi:hypothetical protein